MTLLEFITRVADDANVNINSSGVKDRLIREANRVLGEVFNGFRWSFRWRNYRIVTDTDVTAGTVTATNGSRTITGVGTTFLSTHKNWHIVFNGDPIQNWYKVQSYVSATSIVLDVPYQGTTGNAKAYTLRHFDYVLPTEPWDLGSVVVTNDRRSIPIFEPTGMDIMGPVPFYKGYPMAVSIFGSDDIPTTYSVGSLSAAAINTSQLIASTVLWLSNVFAGDLITIGPNTYTIRSVENDTSIILYNGLQTALAGGETYTITRRFGRIMRVMWPSTDNYTLDIRALRLFAPLVNDNDTHELLWRFPSQLILKTSAMEYGQQDDKRASEMDAKAELALAKAKAEDDALTVRDGFSPVYSYRTGGRGYKGRCVS